MAKAWNNSRTNYAPCPSIQIRPSLTHISAAPDSASRCSIQGDSDSETEVISTISTNLDSMLSSDSSDIEFSDDDAFEDAEKPVFLTARGPIRVDSGQSLHGLPLDVFVLCEVSAVYVNCLCCRFCVVFATNVMLRFCCKLLNVYSTDYPDNGQTSTFSVEVMRCTGCNIEAFVSSNLYANNSYSIYAIHRCGGIHESH